MKFIIGFASPFGIITEYYSGKTYVYQGGVFPCLCDNKDIAKRYTSRKRAEDAAKAFIASTEVIEVTE